MTKTQTIINRILEVDNFQNMATCCDNWAEFTQELEEWGVYGCAKIDFDDPELDLEALDDFFGSFGCTPANPHPCSRRYA